MASRFAATPDFQNAWRRDPYHGTILQWCAVARAHGDIVIVCVGAKMTIIAPEGEFPLGEVGDDDRIAQKFSGRKLVGVSVVKAKTMTRAAEFRPERWRLGGH